MPNPDGGPDSDVPENEDVESDDSDAPDIPEVPIRQQLRQYRALDRKSFKELFQAVTSYGPQILICSLA